jgi:predicted trehalose synthase
VEQHDTDPTHDPVDPWSEAGKRWSSIGEKLRDRYKEVSGDGGPSEAEVRSALETLGEAARAVADSVGNAMKDPDVREQVKDATASFVTALGQTFSQLGDELRNAREQKPETPDED